MIDETYLLDFIDMHIAAYEYEKPPLLYRFVCWLCRIPDRSDVIISELEQIQQFTTSVAMITNIAQGQTQGDPDDDPGVSYG